MDQGNDFLVLFLEPVRAYLEDDDVSEILINGPGAVYVEKKGLLQRAEARFASEPALRAAAANIAKSVGRTLDDNAPRLDARLPDGSRVHAVIPPLSRCGTVIAIRKFKRDTLTIDKLLSFGSVSEDAVNLLRAVVLLHKNVMVAGGTSSGKTSVLNVLSAFIPGQERVLVIEDASELQLQQEHAVAFETRKPDKNGNGEVTLRDLIHSSLRLRPDRLVIGEIRGGEALDLLQALNTGHAGSMSTIHANTPLDCLFRLETCALLGGVEIPLPALRAQVASAIDVVVQTARLSDGTRKLTAIAEVLPLHGGEYRINELLAWQTDSIAPDGRVEGRFVVKNPPTFAPQAALARLPLPVASLP
ncbi:MAG: CpaF family protein [Kiritimatiellaeota bacterium]|nr:CpaF family protein [Kiritimatiellota bacterium]